MNYSKRIMLREEKVSKSTNEGPVCLRITINRRSTYIQLAKVKPEFWNDEKSVVKKSHPNAALINADITRQVAEIEAILIKLDSAKEIMEIEDIRNKLHKTAPLDLFKYADEVIQQLYCSGNFSTYKNYKSIITKLRNYTQKESLPINSINLAFIQKYDLYLTETLHNTPNTIGKNMKTIAKFINDIYEKNALEPINNPFNRYHIKREKSNRCFLAESELNKIESLKIRLQSPLYDAREVFLFQCYTGLRISDALSIKWRNHRGNELMGIMRKTKQTYSIPLIDKAKEILKRHESILINNNEKLAPDRYIFNILTKDVDSVSSEIAHNNIGSKTAIINKQLKKIARLANIEKNISTHIGRHTLATLLITKGADIYQVKEILGHTNVVTTQIYAKMTDARKHEAMNLLNK